VWPAVSAACRRNRSARPWLGIGPGEVVIACTEHPPDHIAATMAGMIYEYRWLAIGVALSLAGLACSRTPMDEQQSGATCTTALQGVFEPTDSMNSGRWMHTATLLPSGRVLIAGGVDRMQQGANSLASAEQYDPVAGKFTAIGSMTVARYRHTATLLGNGKVLIAGGSQSDSASFSSVELYAPAAGKFTVAPSRAGNWDLVTATLLQSGKVLIAGCYDYETDPNLRMGPVDAELYDPSPGVFAVTGSMSADRALGTATLLPDGKVLLAGGANSGWTNAELYDPSSGTFIPTGGMNVARWMHTATLLDNGTVLIAGGDNNNDREGLASAELYDPRSGTFTPTGSMNVARSGHVATSLPDGKVLIVGGGNALASAELYDPVAGTFAATCNMTNGRFQPTATMLPKGRVLIAGGTDSHGEALASAEIYE
jgi:hypothetical protein